MKLKKIAKMMKIKKSYTLGTALIIIGLSAIIINYLKIDWSKVWPVGLIVTGIIIILTNFIDNEL